MSHMQSAYDLWQAAQQPRPRVQRMAVAHGCGGVGLNS